MDKQELQCPVCKADSYLDSKLILLVSSCYHKICENCVNRIFSAGQKPCPICKTQLRKANFVVPIFENMLVEKECRIRKRILKIFNKRQTDFNDLKSYNDYLEEVEDMIFNLVNDVDIQEMNRKIEEYQELNAESISSNIDQDEKEIKNLVEISNQVNEEFEKRKEHHLLEDLQEMEIRQRKNNLGFDEKSKNSKTSIASLARVTLKDKLEKLKDDKDVDNPFEKPLISNFKRFSININWEIKEPLMKHFDEEKLKAGGFKITECYARALESAYSMLVHS
jgi:CDK-activating kinase assembly factor MAT1